MITYLLQLAAAIYLGYLISKTGYGYSDWQWWAGLASLVVLTMF